jgi:hypothetical protein
MQYVLLALAAIILPGGILIPLFVVAHKMLMAHRERNKTYGKA